MDYVTTHFLPMEKKILLLNTEVLKPLVYPFRLKKNVFYVPATPRGDYKWCHNAL